MKKVFSYESQWLPLACKVMGVSQVVGGWGASPGLGMYELGDGFGRSR